MGGLHFVRMISHIDCYGVFVACKKSIMAGIKSGPGGYNPQFSIRGKDALV